jgi:hypothetical protein
MASSILTTAVGVAAGVLLFGPLGLAAVPLLCVACRAGLAVVDWMDGDED